MAAVTDAIGGIILVALVGTIVAHPATSTIISSAGNAFTGSLKVATQGGVG